MKDLEDLLKDAAATADLQNTVGSALSQLGSDPDKIATILYDQGFLGERYAPESCPVALWVNDAISETEHISVKVDRRDVLLESSGRVLRLPVTEGVALFVERFDGGSYPDLEAALSETVHLGGLGDFYVETTDELDEGEEDYDQ